MAEINFKWKEITPKLARCFKWGDEEVIYVIKTGLFNVKQYVVIHDDANQIDTGETELLTGEQLKEKYGIVLND